MLVWNLPSFCSYSNVLYLYGPTVELTSSWIIHYSVFTSIVNTKNAYKGVKGGAVTFFINFMKNIFWSLYHTIDNYGTWLFI